MGTGASSYGVYYLFLGMQYIQCAFWDLARFDLPSFRNGNRNGFGRMICLDC